MDIDTASTAGNEPIEGQTPQSKSPKPSNNKQTKGDPTLGKKGSNNNKNKKKSAAKEKTTQASNEPSNTPSLGSHSSQTHDGDKPGGGNGREKGKMTYKEHQAWKKARTQARAAISVPQDNTDSTAANAPPAPASGTSDIPPPPAPPSNTPLDPALSSAPTLSTRAMPVPATAPPASTPSTTSAPSVPIFASLNTAPTAVPPPPVAGITQPSDFNFKEISQPTSQLGPLSGKREGSPDLPPEKRRKSSRSIENGDDARAALPAAAQEENAVGGQT
ncbi:hypothetical protein Forpe1208_v008508 [Fusarium oxysporum f. sp. rapae]|uniref:Uncharacterized protein n=1 Tax=Fusarium oxysporum f. sp. rapae TaxID=485398 RepID=A0A8J5P6X0_FUSOX|nr:hypothetical protein Forpe1208_v008508 [Fusarium oxysporum f. sp. rapae]